MAELRVTVNNLRIQMELGKSRIEELEGKISRYQSYASSTTREFWDRYWAIKARGAKTDLPAYDKEIREELSATQATGTVGPGLPEEFRSGLDQYFNRLETWQNN